MNRKRMAWRGASLFILVGTAALAQGVPGTVAFTARLSDASGPLNGPHAFGFALFDAATGGTLSWSETATVPVTNGMAYAGLGTTRPLDATVFNGAPLFLEVTVDGQVLSPRAAIASVPYAVRAGVANDAAALGGLAPADFQRRVSGACPSGAVESIRADGTVTCTPVAAPNHTHSAADVTSGVLATSVGGTGANLAATGGAGQYVKQSAAGAAFSVGAIAATDLPSLAGTYVDRSTAQSIGGVKTFSSTIQGSVSGSAASFTGSLAGDVIGTQGATTVVALRGTAVANVAPSAANPLLRFNGATWTPAPVALGTDVTGVLPVANGGTGLSALPPRGVGSNFQAIPNGTTYLYPVNVTTPTAMTCLITATGWVSLAAAAAGGQTYVAYRDQAVGSTDVLLNYGCYFNPPNPSWSSCTIPNAFTTTAGHTYAVGCALQAGAATTGYCQVTYDCR